MNVTVAGAVKVSESKMYLATVTCNRDFRQMLLQAESIGKFVEPCRHIILVNEPNPNIKFWYRWLAPYYKNHELEIIPPYPMLTRHKITNDVISGWTSQQLQKLLIGMKTHHIDDYVLLDTKNFFIRPTNLSEFQDMYGSGQINQIGEEFQYTTEYYADYFNVPVMQKTFAVQTPFVIHNSYLRKYWPDQIEDMLIHGVCKSGPNLGKPIMVSEFMLYSYLMDRSKFDLLSDSNYNFRIANIVWEWNMDSMEQLLYQPDDQKVKVCGFHRQVLKHLYPSGFDFINDWLKNHIGLNNKIYPMLVRK